ncbi:anthranilate phosphoribosyltransferase [candidate division KSB1 bacterium]|nr:MAG: anthranilate phosphoribosyltransferase [candidate division KSB1 bacterium]
MSVKSAIEKVSNRKGLSFFEAREAAMEIMRGEADESRIAALLMGLRVKGETADEVQGFADAMRQKADKVRVRDEYLVDTCGTGGDGLNTFNVSTIAGIVAAGAGCRVAKHGNSSVSSRCGSANLFEALGVNINLNSDQMAECIEKNNFGFLYAPRLHAAMKYAMPVRKKMGIRTIFNMLGPITNPADVKRQVVGVYSEETARVIADAILNMGSDHVLVVHSRDGLDEISVSAPTTVFELKNGTITRKEISPEDFNFKRCSLEEIKGGGPEENAEIALSVLRGRKGPKRDFVLLNSGAVIYVSGKAGSIKEGIKMAEEAIDSGRALDVFNDFKEMSNNLNA